MSIRFGIVSDPQYSNIDDMKGRQYRKSLDKLDYAIKKLNSEELDFVIQLGDFIDHEYESFAPAMKVWANLKHQNYHVLGNHDFCVGTAHKPQVLEALGSKSAYYQFEYENFRFIVLNGNGLSLNAFDAESEMYQFSENYWESLNCESEWWNGAVDLDQLRWLEEILQDAESTGKSVVIFCHYPLLGEQRFVLWNSHQLLETIERYSCVKFWMNGHYHEGAYSAQNGIHHLTIKGMVQFTEPTFAIAGLSENSLALTGFGEEESRILEF